MSADIQKKFYERLLEADRKGAIEVVDQWGLEHGYTRVVSEMLEPAFEELNDLLNNKNTTTFSLAHGYVMAKVAEEILLKASAAGTGEAKVGEVLGPVVIGNIEDDYHALGRKMVGIFLRTAGWEVHDLGNDVLAVEFVDKAESVGAKIIGASAMMHTTALNIKGLREEIDKRGLKNKIQLAVGGAVFIARPSLIQEVGGDGTAKNAMEAPQQMAKLLDRFAD